MSKKQSQFMMGVFTVLLTVTFITFLNTIAQLSPVVILQSSLYAAGDMDLVITGNMDTTVKPVIGNTNYYVDENEFFNAQVYSQSQKTASMTK